MHKALGWGIVIIIAGGSLVLAQQPQQPQPRSPYEEVILELLGALGQMTKTLTAVNDGPSAEAARPALKEAVARFLSVRDKAAAELRQPDRPERDRIVEAYQKKLADAVDGLQMQIRRVQAIPSARDVLKELGPLQPSQAKEKTKSKS